MFRFSMFGGEVSYVYIAWRTVCLHIVSSCIFVHMIRCTFLVTLVDEILWCFSFSNLIGCLILSQFLFTISTECILFFLLQHTLHDISFSTVMEIPLFEPAFVE